MPEESITRDYQVPLDEAEEDEDIFTDFDTETGICGGESVDGSPVWGARCPQPDCGYLNIFEGEPEDFASRPYACQDCGWACLMHESVRELEVPVDA